jgi:hypothetical protein
MKRFLILLLIPTLVGCGSAKPSLPTKKIAPITIPSSCLESKVLTAVQSDIPDVTFIDTKWTPAPDTELADVLNNGGIACSYGVANAEIGATVRWVLDTNNIYEKWSSTWIKEGYTKVDLVKFGLTDGYFLMKPQSATQEFAIWNLNFKAGGVWISISKSSGDSLEAGSKLIEAVIAQR